MEKPFQSAASTIQRQMTHQPLVLSGTERSCNSAYTDSCEHSTCAQSTATAFAAKINAYLPRPHHRKNKAQRKHARSAQWNHFVPVAVFALAALSASPCHAFGSPRMLYLPMGPIHLNQPRPASTIPFASPRIQMDIKVDPLYSCGDLHWDTSTTSSVACRRPSGLCGARQKLEAALSWSGCSIHGTTHTMAMKDIPSSAPNSQTGIEIATTCWRKPTSADEGVSLPQEGDARSDVQEVKSRKSASGAQRRPAEDFHVFLSDVPDLAVDADVMSKKQVPDLETCIADGFCTLSSDGRVRMNGRVYACSPAGDQRPGTIVSPENCAVWYGVQ